MSRKPNQPTFKEHPVSHALRGEGFFPLPRLWVKQEDLEVVIQMANKHRATVNKIRAEVHAQHPELEDRRPSAVKKSLVEADFAKIEQAVVAQAVSDKEAAWAAYERMRNGSTN